MIFRRAHQNARRLIDSGNDPLKVICEHAHAKGLPVYSTLLVQQGRGPQEQDVRCSEFRFASAHLEIGAKTGVDESWLGHRCLDFAHDEVREERYALIEETVRRYPVDGFELQLNYNPYYFHPDEVADGRPLMTDWVRRVAQTVRDSGAGRRLAVRVPLDLQRCHDIGLDVAGWMRDSLIDIVIGEACYGPEQVDCNADYRELVAEAKGVDVHVMATQQSLIDSDRLDQAPVEIIRASACNYWEQGVDGLYLGHWFGNWPFGPEFYEKLRELPHPEVMAPRDKYYFTPTATGRLSGLYDDRGVEFSLPLELTAGQTVSAPLVAADDLARWHADGRVHEVILRCRLQSATETDVLRFRLNGQELPPGGLRRINEMYRMAAPRYRTGSSYWFVHRLGPDHWPRVGQNIFEVELAEREPEAVPPVVLRDVELEIRYLKGRAFHRGFVDPDLGPYNVGVA